MRDVARAFHVQDALQFGIRQVQDGHLVRCVHEHPQFTVHDGEVVARVADALHDLGIGLCKDVGAVCLVSEVQQVQGGSTRERALGEDVQLGEAAIIITYFVDFDTRELIVGGVFLGATRRYRDEDHAENQQCVFFHM